MQQALGGELDPGAPPGEQRLLQGRGHQLGLLRGADSPAEDAAGVDIGDEADVAEPCGGPHVGEVRAPPLVRPGGVAPPPLHVIRVPGRLRVSDGGDGAAFAAFDPADPGDAHQPLDPVSAPLVACPASCLPEFSASVEPPVGDPEVEQGVGIIGVLQSPLAGQETTGLVGVESGRGDLGAVLGEHLADRLDPEP